MRIAPSVGPMHGVQANANAAPGDQRAARAGAADQRVGAPLAVELRHERREQEQHAERDDHDARRSCRASRASPASVEPSPVAVIPSATNTAVNERQKTIAGSSTLSERALAALQLGDADARHRRQVAGDERQHAGRDERDEADRERGDDRRVDAARSSVEGGELGVEPPRVVGVERAGGRRRAGGRAPRGRGRAPAPRDEHDERQRRRARRAIGTSHAVELKPSSSGSASTRGAVLRRRARP